MHKCLFLIRSRTWSWLSYQSFKKFPHQVIWTMSPWKRCAGQSGNVPESYLPRWALSYSKQLMTSCSAGPRMGNWVITVTHLALCTNCTQSRKYFKSCCSRPLFARLRQPIAIRWSSPMNLTKRQNQSVALALRTLKLILPCSVSKLKRSKSTSGSSISRNYFNLIICRVLHAICSTLRFYWKRCWNHSRGLV